MFDDARRSCDITFANTKIIKARIESSDVVRMSRGCKFDENVDDRPTMMITKTGHML